MKTNDVTVKILKDIRGELQGTNAQLAQTNARLDQTNARLDLTNAGLDQVREELSARIVESEIRTATALTDLAGSVREMTAVLRHTPDLTPRVEKCEEEIAQIKARLPAA